MKQVSIILMISLILFGCSNPSMDNSNAPDQMQRDGNQMRASKQIGEYELQLIIEATKDHTFIFQPGIKYIGIEADNEILHSKQILDVDLQMGGETILPPRSITSEGLTTKLMKDHWYSEKYEITLTSEQIEQIKNSDVDIVLNAVFQSEQSSFEDEKKIIISAEEVLIN
ncbi:hypothetical protein [Paenibacillus sp. Z3-2]